MSTEGGVRTRDLSLEDAKRKGLNDLVEPVQLDVMDLLDGRKVMYLNTSHQIIRGGLVINWL